VIIEKKWIGNEGKREGGELPRSTVLGRKQYMQQYATLSHKSHKNFFPIYPSPPPSPSSSATPSYLELDKLNFGGWRMGSGYKRA